MIRLAVNVFKNINKTLCTKVVKFCTHITTVCVHIIFACLLPTLLYVFSTPYSIVVFCR